MKRMTCLVAAVLCSQLSAAGTVMLDPGISNPDGAGLQFVIQPASDMAHAEFKVGVECLSNGRYLPVFASAEAGFNVWTPGTGDNYFSTPFPGLPEGRLRIVVSVRDPNDPDKVLSRSRSVVQTPVGYTCGQVHSMNELERRYDETLSRLGSAFASIAQKLSAGESPGAEFETFSSANKLVAVLNPVDDVAPQGGPALLASGPDSTLDTLGAIGVEILSPPTAPSNWEGVEVAIHMPEYLVGLPVHTTARTTVLKFCDFNGSCEAR